MVVKVNISLPEDVLKELDRAAHESNTSLSAFLAEAVKHYLEEKEEERKRERRMQAAANITRLAEKIGPWKALQRLSNGETDTSRGRFCRRQMVQCYR